MSFRSKVIYWTQEFLDRAKPCPHLSIDELGRCDTCFHWYPDWNPQDRSPIKRASEMSILASEPESPERTPILGD
jgi:hypothetical protein